MHVFTLRYTLKQHTPLIHFQDQEGATLRATELKPKLDRFLREKEPNLPFREHHKGRFSLDYKVYIKANPKITSTPDHHPLFFGNMGEGAVKKFSFADEVSITFIAFDSSIADAVIDDVEPEMVKKVMEAVEEKKLSEKFHKKCMNQLKLRQEK